MTLAQPILANEDANNTGIPNLPENKKSAAETDWQPKRALNNEQQEAMRSECEGIYVDPFADQPSPDPANTLIEINAGEADMNAKRIQLGDGVRVRQGPRVIQASEMMFDKVTEQAEMKGNVSIRQTGSLIHGNTASVNMIGNEASFTDGSFLAHQLHIRGSAASISHEANGTLVMKNGRFTSCEPENKGWELSGGSLIINPEAQQGTGRNVVIRIADIPVIYTPYIRFPVGGARQTGLLAPSFGTLSGEADIAIPWYWNIAPNQDATFTPRYVGARGALLEAEYRHLSRVNSNVIRGFYLPSDQGKSYDGSTDTDAATGPISPFDNHKGEARSLLNIEHEGGFRQPWSSFVDFGRTSDIDVLRNLPAASFSVTNETYLTQNATLGYDFSHWHISANVYNAQNLLTDVDDSYRRMPQFQAEGNYYLGDFGIRVYNEFVRFDHRQKEHLDGTPIITGDRARIDYQLLYRQETSWGFIKPSVGMQGAAYALNDEGLKDGASAHPTLITHYADLDGGLVFENSAGSQSLEPRFYYLFRQYADHADVFNVTDDGQSINFDTSPLTFSFDQLFRAHRFAGGDRLDDANQLTLGLTHRMNTNNGQPLWDISLGQLFYFDDRNVGLNTQTDSAQESDIATQYKIYINPNWQTLGSFQYNPQTEKMIRASFGVHFNEDDWLVNLNYRYSREQPLATGDLSQPIDQIDTSFFLPIKDQWHIVGRSFYDIDEYRELESFIGFEYSACCYRIRTVARRWLDANLALNTDSARKPYDQGLFFEIELIGLGGSGNRIETLLSDSIFGYNPDR
ncbi:MAG: LPS assembly protein LptD [Marinagarivorans sp.]|nr:LPS assembly protein LptD [Marinagarivorans sp.]